ncbi:Hypothetical_protein [Hexamita inflata]|uniref:Hypothetical_protein n=1 Tax=Hexamita inflata TaxID=28002 RepID=A0AA86RI41_9EUKA|nr:Hypothetical protein HINF_LOCUS62848 [Hexamita inflata]
MLLAVTSTPLMEYDRLLKYYVVRKLELKIFPANFDSLMTYVGRTFVSLMDPVIEMLVNTPETEFAKEISIFQQLAGMDICKSNTNRASDNIVFAPVSITLYWHSPRQQMCYFISLIVIIDASALVLLDTDYEKLYWTLLIQPLVQDLQIRESSVHSPSDKLY